MIASANPIEQRFELAAARCGDLTPCDLLVAFFGVIWDTLRELLESA